MPSCLGDLTKSQQNAALRFGVFRILMIPFLTWISFLGISGIFFQAHPLADLGDFFFGVALFSLPLLPVWALVHWLVLLLPQNPLRSLLAVLIPAIAGLAALFVITSFVAELFSGPWV